jgi:two-component system response regulator CpxR
VRGFGEGVDDYLVKPFAASELLGRIRAILRRTARLPPAPPRVSAIGALTLDVQIGEAFWDGAAAGLTPTEFAILDVLARSAGRIVSRDELTAALHQREATPYERALDVHVSHLRRKLDVVARASTASHARRWLIRTVRGVGYLYTTER